MASDRDGKFCVDVDRSVLVGSDRGTIGPVHEAEASFHGASYTSSNRTHSIRIRGRAGPASK